MHPASQPASQRLEINVPLGPLPPNTSCVSLPKPPPSTLRKHSTSRLTARLRWWRVGTRELAWSQSGSHHRQQLQDCRSMADGADATHPEMCRYFQASQCSCRHGSLTSSPGIGADAFSEALPVYFLLSDLSSFSGTFNLLSCHGV